MEAGAICGFSSNTRNVAGSSANITFASWKASAFEKKMASSTSSQLCTSARSSSVAVKSSRRNAMTRTSLAHWIVFSLAISPKINVPKVRKRDTKTASTAPSTTRPLRLMLFPASART